MLTIHVGASRTLSTLPAKRLSVLFRSSILEEIFRIPPTIPKREHGTWPTILLEHYVT